MEPWGIRTPEGVHLGGLRFETVEYTPGHWAERHAHEIAFADLILSGAQDGRWAGEDVRRAPGTVALMPAGAFHATDSVLPTRTFQLTILRSWPGFSESKSPRTGPCAHFEPGPIAWRMTQMWAEFRRRDDLTPLVLEGRVGLFLDDLDGRSDEGEGGSPKWLRRAHEYVRAHAVEGFTVANVAAAADVAPGHLMRSYVRRYGVTLGDDARRLRVAHACRLLASRGPSLGEVALAAGFTDQSHLNRVFKQHTGLTPREYRETSLGR